MLDLETLLKPALAEPPSGPDLEYSIEFTGLRRAALGKPEQQVGATIVAAEPPAWREIAAQSAALLVRSKDLRVAALLARALVEVHGFVGLADALALLRRLVEQYWDTLHPALDAEEGGDPTARLNAIGALAHREALQALRGAPFVVAKLLGAITPRMIDAAHARAAAGKAGSADGPTLAAIEAALEQTPREVLVEAAAVLARATREAHALSAAVAARVRTGAPDFAAIETLLRQATVALKPTDGRSAIKPDLEAVGAASASAPGAASPPAAVGEVRSRDDAVRALDAICAYYARSEPSSPVPLLLQRSRRLIAMSFVELLKEMLPESLPTFQKIAGKTDA